jgi:hypothetical protein
MKGYRVFKSGGRKEEGLPKIINQDPRRSKQAQNAAEINQKIAQERKDAQQKLREFQEAGMLTNVDEADLQAALEAVNLLPNTEEFKLIYNFPKTNSAKFRIILAMLTLAIAFGEVATDEDVINKTPDLFSILTTLVVALSQYAQSTSKTIIDTAEEGLKLYQENLSNPLFQRFSTISNTALNTLLVASARKGRSRVLTLPELAMMGTLTPTTQAISDKDVMSFSDACATGNVDFVKTKLSKTKDPKTLLKLLTSDAGGSRAAFLVACNRGQTEIVKLILNAIKDDRKLLKDVLESKQEHGMTAIMLALSKMQEDVVIQILSAAEESGKPLLKSVLSHKTKNGFSLPYFTAYNGQNKLSSIILSERYPFFKQILPF